MPATLATHPALVALDRHTGCQLRTATAAEIAAWIEQPITGSRKLAAQRKPIFRFTFHKAIRVGEVLIDTVGTGGGWHGGAGF